MLQSLTLKVLSYSMVKQHIEEHVLIFVQRLKKRTIMHKFLQHNVMIKRWQSRHKKNASDEEGNH